MEENALKPKLPQQPTEPVSDGERTLALSRMKPARVSCREQGGGAPGDPLPGVIQSCTMNHALGRTAQREGSQGLSVSLQGQCWSCSLGAATCLFSLCTHRRPGHALSRERLLRDPLSLFLHATLITSQSMSPSTRRAGQASSCLVALLGSATAPRCFHWVLSAQS